MPPFSTPTALSTTMIRTTTSLLRTPIRHPLLSRPLSTTPHLYAPAENYTPPSNMPPSAQKAGKSNLPSEDEQSSASKHPAPNSSDDHPAKQPDPQAEVDRKTGFGNVEGGVPGGKEGLGWRSDKS